MAAAVVGAADAASAMSSVTLMEEQSIHFGGDEELFFSVARKNIQHLGQWSMEIAGRI